MLSARPVGLSIDADTGLLAKTPARGLIKTRNALQENAHHVVPTTALGKGRKMVQNTPFQSKTLHADHVKDLNGKQVGPSKSKDAPIIRPLGDKTPFPNRTANQIPPTGTKIAKPGLYDGSLRPSSARKHDRLPRSASKAFETPITNGKHWDVSDIEIQVDAPVANQSIEEESYDEIEYMPPKVEVVQYEPPFEMPNYREVGKTLMALIRSYTLEDDPPSTELTFTVDVSETDFFTPPVLPQQEIATEDDGPFARPKSESKQVPEVKPQPSAKVRPRSATTSKVTLRSATQRTTTGTRIITPANPRVPATVRRPATATSTRPPISAARTSSSQPVTRASSSQATVRPPASRATTRAPSVARVSPPTRSGSTQLSYLTTISRPTLNPAARSTAPTAPIKEKTTKQPSSNPAIRNHNPPSNVPPNSGRTRSGTITKEALESNTTRNPIPPGNIPRNAGRPRSGTITKEAFESNTHVAVHIKNNSLEDVKKDLEGLIVFEDAFSDEDDGFRFDV